LRKRLIKILNEEDTKEEGDLGCGTKAGSGTARIRPILSGDEFKYLVIYDKTQNNKYFKK
jgi:hypothetical protein